MEEVKAYSSNIMSRRYIDFRGVTPSDVLMAMVDYYTNATPNDPLATREIHITYDVKWAEWVGVLYFQG